MVAAIGSLIKTKRLLGRIPLESLLEQKEMNDPYKSAALEISTTVNSSLYAANPTLYSTITLKTLRWSLNYGITNHTVKCIGIYALFEMVFGNTESATKVSHRKTTSTKRLTRHMKSWRPMASSNKWPRTMNALAHQST